MAKDQRDSTAGNRMGMIPFLYPPFFIPQGSQPDLAEIAIELLDSKKNTFLGL